jgi:hypothetical protein
MRRLKFHPPALKNQTLVRIFSKIGGVSINKNTLHNRKKIPCVLAVAWYLEYMKRNELQRDNNNILRIAGTGKRDYIISAGGYDICNVRANNTAEAEAKGKAALGRKVMATLEWQKR